MSENPHQRKFRSRTITMAPICTSPDLLNRRIKRALSIGKEMVAKSETPSPTKVYETDSGRLIDLGELLNPPRSADHDEERISFNDDSVRRYYDLLGDNDSLYCLESPQKVEMQEHELSVISSSLISEEDLIKEEAHTFVMFEKPQTNLIFYEKLENTGEISGRTLELSDSEISTSEKAVSPAILKYENDIKNKGKLGSAEKIDHQRLDRLRRPSKSSKSIISQPYSKGSDSSKSLGLYAKSIRASQYSSYESEDIIKPEPVPIDKITVISNLSISYDEEKEHSRVYSIKDNTESIAEEIPVEEYKAQVQEKNNDERKGKFTKVVNYYQTHIKNGSEHLSDENDLLVASGEHQQDEKKSDSNRKGEIKKKIKALKNENQELHQQVQDLKQKNEELESKINVLLSDEKYSIFGNNKMKFIKDLDNLLKEKKQIEIKLKEKDNDLSSLRNLNEKLLKEKVEFMTSFEEFKKLKATVKQYEEITQLKPNSLQELKKYKASDIELRKNIEEISKENETLKKVNEALERAKNMLLKEKKIKNDEQEYLLNLMNSYKDQRDSAHEKIRELEKVNESKDVRCQDLISKCKGFQQELKLKEKSPNRSPKKDSYLEQIGELKKSLYSKLSSANFRSTVSL